jgi:hypothetical protein
VQHIRSLAPKYGVDTRAALAVAAAEGLGGGAGDYGTSYGPFQLHRGGALPPGKDQAWAESPAGIEHAIRQISSVAKGKTGADAIAAIVNNFERPSDPQGEIQRALDIYSGKSANVSPPAGGGVRTASRSTGSSGSRTSTDRTRVAKAPKITIPKIPRVKVARTPAIRVRLGPKYKKNTTHRYTVAKLKAPKIKA